MRDRQQPCKSRLRKAALFHLRRLRRSADSRTTVQYGVVLFLVVGLIYHFIFSSTPHSPSSPSSSSSSSSSSKSVYSPASTLPWLKRSPENSGRRGVSVWYMPPCRGTFHSQSAKHSDVGFPYAIIRDATVDRRPVTVTTLRGCRHPSAVRFTLYLSVHYSVTLSRKSIITTIAHPGLNLSVHYVLHATQFLLRGPYVPGKRTFFGHRATEWHVGLCLFPKPSVNNDDDESNNIHNQDNEGPEPEQILTAAIDNDARFDLTVNARRFDGVDVILHFDMSLGCVQGWETPGLELMPDQASQRMLLLTNRQISSVPGLCDARDRDHAQFGGVSGAALFSGSALYGYKKRDAKYYREIAHFALRAIEGPIRYDMVVMSVVADATVSDAAMQCAGLTEGDEEELCHERLRLQNNALLDAVANEITSELRMLNAQPETASKIILIPSCTLGSDAVGSERGDACNQTKHYGQYWATVFAYAPVAPYFRWAVSNDMDEFLMPENSQTKGALQWQYADKVLETANEHTEGDPNEGSFVAQWLNFLVQSQDDIRGLSRKVMSGHVPSLTNREDVSQSHTCYDRLSDDTGKSVVRCNVGFGFTVHSSIFVVRTVTGRVNFTLGWRVNRDLRTWHARLDSSKGSCEYKESAI